VRDEQERLPAFARLPKEPEHVASRRRVEIAGRLVGENDVGGVRQRARQRDPLLLAARQLGRSGFLLLGNP
jgi:hypothetical protein